MTNYVRLACWFCVLPCFLVIWFVHNTVVLRVFILLTVRIQMWCVNINTAASTALLLKDCEGNRSIFGSWGVRRTFPCVRMCWVSFEIRSISNFGKKWLPYLLRCSWASLNQIKFDFEWLFCQLLSIIWIIITDSFPPKLDVNFWHFLFPFVCSFISFYDLSL